MSGAECVLVSGHHAVVWGPELFNDHTQLVECQRIGFKFTIFLFAFYLSHLLLIPSSLLFLSRWGLFLFHFVLFVGLLGIITFFWFDFDF